jgi:hypothetical protein
MIDNNITYSINLLLEKKQYEDLLFVYSLNYKVLIPFFDFFQKMELEDRTIILEYILKSRAVTTNVFSKVINSSYFYNALQLDKAIKNY